MPFFEAEGDEEGQYEEEEELGPGLEDEEGVGIAEGGAVEDGDEEDDQVAENEEQDECLNAFVLLAERGDDEAGGADDEDERHLVPGYVDHGEQDPVEVHELEVGEDHGLAIDGVGNGHK